MNKPIYLLLFTISLKKTQNMTSIKRTEHDIGKKKRDGNRAKHESHIFRFAYEFFVQPSDVTGATSTARKYSDVYTGYHRWCIVNGIVLPATAVQFSRDLHHYWGEAVVIRRGTGNVTMLSFDVDKAKVILDRMRPSKNNVAK
jgi:hypothetical protein